MKGFATIFFNLTPNSFFLLEKFLPVNSSVVPEAIC